MGDTDRTTAAVAAEGGGSWENLQAVSAKVLVPGVSKELVTDLYNQWANHGYDKVHQDAASGEDYGALRVLQQTMQDLFPTGRDTAVLLDVGAGTGLSGQMLWEIGFKTVDGLDPAADMLRVAEQKQIYRHIYNCYLTGQPSQIPGDTYDAVVLVGVVGHGGLPSVAFEEMTRIVKPGGYIVNCMRRAYMVEVPDYAQNWQPMQQRLQTEGRWEVLHMDPYPNHFLGTEGLRMVIRVVA